METLLGEHGGVSLTRDFVGFYIHIRVPFWGGGPELATNLSCGTEEETSVNVLCECDALASLTYISGFLLLDPEYMMKLSTVAIWNFAKGTGLL